MREDPVNGCGLSVDKVLGSEKDRTLEYHEEASFKRFQSSLSISGFFLKGSSFL